MDVVLGVAVTGSVARLALVGAGAASADVIDQSAVDLANNPIEQLTETVVGTNRLLADENHRLVGTRLCWTDHPKADQLRQALEDSGVHNVAVLSESQAVTALMRAAGRPGAVLVVDDETATLSLLGSAAGDVDAPPTLLAREPLAGGSEAEATGTFDTLMARLSDQPDAPRDVYVVGASSDLTRVADQLRDASTMRVEIPDDPTFALARGAAMAAAPLTGDATAMAPAAALTGDETTSVPAAEFADPNAQEQQLAYSMADDAESVPAEMDEFDDFDDPDVQTGPQKLSRRSLLLGNAVIAFAVIGFASLAVAVVVAVRPTASQEPVVGHQNAAPGKFMPLLPTQQQAPVPPPPADQPNAGFQGGTIPAPAVGGSVPQQGTPPAVGPAPAAPVPVTPGGPGAPGVPGFVPNPNPNVPIPVPIIIPFPGWQPQPPPYVPPYTPPTAPPTTPYTPPTTPPTTPPHTTPPSTPPHTTPPTTPPHTTPPTTQPVTPKTSSTVPTTVSPPPSTKPPTQQTVPPPQTHSQQPVTPQQPGAPQQPVVPQQPHNRHGF